ncbi:hypothetical protein COV53_03595 [Candidatus Gottesmanbacteria bacterium CG11_big_fil_rev_8_21_14_0_20_37_11]|uniref:Uncharacterized protein n=3 Tax=Candidatus Gottesmaniibacteriota TaxID=1752720 RepID=A0A2M7RRQ7_9BACT|nr:MAG: hypothetical protein AUJ73_01245 [Candidatus Gottesmanbacteria bacterium CG1_02_37_22]PIP32892.1 MAG: hypothetical protein COX23_02440 [Candidatus Gottesmanbacteria bacterium CG23_combo_of_CG06-09_8_20_14_all_37_19]PIR08298.1 MAG: hypothetical protein COV53_03595 [Candidatus Gottesmanbacteria bacterium CG11_big_fil_rev_8_21_14_0_20_37_11]PIZ03007.1 MAG: hypothetical protein COY59_01910 [Candidatus Gottesmanbacteria bacterium CG_4_10_14_0_8_um_filter_37_24]
MKMLVLNLQKYLALRLNLVIYILGYAIPFIIARPQFLTGTIVNALIFTASEKLDRKSLYPILFLPSLGAITHGVLFDPQTIFLVYFLPFIWLGNYLQAGVFSLARQQKYTLRVFASALSKYFLLFIAANIYYQLHIVPKMFVTSMGMIQLVTTCTGGFLSYFIIKTLRKEVR